MKNEYMEQLKSLDEQEQSVLCSMRCWRESIGRADWATLSGTWRRSSSRQWEYDKPFLEAMTEEEMIFHENLCKIFDFIQEEKKRVLENYLRSIK